MSKLSITESNWINIVFEGKNKEYGAYQLRKDSDKTTLLALFMGVVIVTSLVSISALINLITAHKKINIETPDFINTHIILSDILPNKPKNTAKLVIPIKKKQVDNVDKKEQLINPVVVKPIDANQNIAANTDNTNKSDTNTDTTTTVGTSTTISYPTETGTGTTTTGTESSINTTTALDKLPEFPGGISKFYNYVGNHFEKPELNEEKTVRVYVYFVIERDGSMTDIHVKNNPGYGLDKEAIRVLKSLKTKWSPGMISGKPVRTSYNLPITVVME